MNSQTTSQLVYTPLPTREGQGGGSSLRIIFMGTPDFAVASLRALVENSYNVVAVVTMPDKAVGRHHDTLQASPVKEYAVGQGIPVLQPEKLKDETFLAELSAFHADLQVVVAFRMLPEVVWNMPPMGTFNLHAALLPQYRGAAPINWAVINGDTQTGVTTFFLDHDIDTGRIIHRVPVPIADTDTAGDVHDHLMTVGAELVLQTVRDIEAGNINAVAQEELCQGLGDETPLRPAPKIFKETCRIPWNRLSMKQAYDFIRGLSPYPAAWTTLRTSDGKEQVLKIYASEKEVCTADVPEQASPETAELPLLSDGRTFLKVALPGGYLRLTTIQLAGKKRMPVADFLRGAHIDGAVLVVQGNEPV